MSEVPDPHFEIRTKKVSSKVHGEKHKPGSKVRNESCFETQHVLVQGLYQAFLKMFYLNYTNKQVTLEEKRHNKFSQVTVTSYWLDKLTIKPSQLFPL